MAKYDPNFQVVVPMWLLGHLTTEHTLPHDSCKNCQAIKVVNEIHAAITAGVGAANRAAKRRYQAEVQRVLANLN